MAIVGARLVGSLIGGAAVLCAVALPTAVSTAAVAAGEGAFSVVDITFDGMATDTPIGAQSAPGDGVVVTFTSATANNGNAVEFFGGPDTIAANFAPEADPTLVVNPITLDFSSSVRRVGFAAATTGAQGMEVEAFRLVEGLYVSQGTLPYAVDAPTPPDFVGIEDSAGIDRIAVSAPGGGLFGIDDVRLDVLPEPSGLVIFSAAAAALFRRPRRSPSCV